MRWYSRTKIVLVLVTVLIMPTVLIISPVEAKSKAEWTFMVYMDADNNLDAFGYENMNAMKSIGSTQDVNIVVLWDKYDDVASLYKVTDEPEIIHRFPLNGTEVNMGAP